MIHTIHRPSSSLRFFECVYSVPPPRVVHAYIHIYIYILTEALRDAQWCVELKPDWAKGYNRCLYIYVCVYI